VHLYGHPAEMDSILEIAGRYGLIVIEDACQAHGAEYAGKKAGSFGAMACFSFYPTKNLGGCGDGGMVVTSHPKYDQKLRLLRCYGEVKKYHNILRGYNSRLDELQAAILRIKLRYLDTWNEARRKKAHFYTKMLSPLDVVCPAEAEKVRHVYYVYAVEVRDREALQVFLKKEGIDTLIHYPVPIPLQKAYQALKLRKKDFPLASRWSRRILSLPFFPEMRENEMEEVVEAIRFFLKNRNQKR
jgi:dTDP-4-amino-4,6-dideoxygalactose transaminase